MPLNIISNFAANVAHRNLTINDSAATNSLAKLSAGTRVISAKDDAAALAVGNRLSAEVAGLKQAQVNAGQGVSMLQIADGAMSKVNDVLQRMKTLAVQAGSGQLSSTERSMIDTEYQALISEIDRISNDTDFAGTKLVDGSFGVTVDAASGFNLAEGVEAVTFKGDFDTGSSGTVSYDTTSNSFTVAHGGLNYSGTLSSDAHDGTSMTSGTVVKLTNSTTDRSIELTLNQTFAMSSNATSGSIALTGSSTSSFTFKVGTGTSSTADNITVSVNSISASQLGISTGDVTSQSNADVASAAVSNAIDDVQNYRATVGANQNRLEFASANIATTMENTEAARSALLDLDIAQEMSNFTSKQILVQAGVSMLAQANQLPQGLLRLFG
ncbi:MAG: flagellin [Rhodospirillaceae bacterium]